jgi:GT2 family glycosyltransferase
LNANKYSISGNWTFKFNETNEPYLENQKKGKIIIDKAVKRVLESFHSSTFAEIDQKKMVSRKLLETILNVFCRVGVLTPGTGPANAAAGEKNRDSNALNQHPLVSIVIINLDEDNHLPELVDSVSRQSYQNLETIMVDTRAKNHNAQQLKKQYPGINILELKGKTTFAKALNKGIQRAGGDFILVLDNHIVLDEHAVYEMMKIALSKKKWAAISPKLKYYDNPSFIHSMGKSLSPYFGMGENYSGCVDLGQFDDRVENVSASFSAVLLNREIIKIIGMADPFYKFSYADLDWCFRARVQGYPVFNAPGAAAYCKHSDLTGKKSRCFRTLYPAGNRFYFVVKNLERKSIWRFLINYAVEDIKNMLIYLKRKQFPLFFAYPGSYLRLIKSIPSLFYQRCKIQRKRKIKGDAAVFAESAPLNFSLVENGIPKLDTHSLRTHYSFLHSKDQQGEVTGKNAGDIVIWQERKENDSKKRWEKHCFDFSFSVKEQGKFDIFLLGFITKDIKLYLDNRRIHQKTKKNYNIALVYPAARNIFLSGGKHFIQLERKNHVREIILRRSNI